MRVAHGLDLMLPSNFVACAVAGKIRRPSPGAARSSNATNGVTSTSSFAEAVIRRDIAVAPRIFCWLVTSALCG